MYAFFLLPYNYTYSDLPRLLEEVFAKKRETCFILELTLGEFSYLRRIPAKNVITRVICRFSSLASDHFLWPQYFIRGIFNASDTFKKNVISFQCSLTFQT
ncbi:hypothetical protein RF11_11460 [Thelohanellus kitauei]|uniref:Uncharacterized protein n=1 Tax=Thelohanellus kitauei TaxID=669202 RepID=A0A0C2IVI5_THEKT|nr:hypothetical protein RF11_11460 [Thelohanellus kitauei]